MIFEAIHRQSSHVPALPEQGPDLGLTTPARLLPDEPPLAIRMAGPNQTIDVNQSPTR